MTVTREALLGDRALRAAAEAIRDEESSTWSEIPPLAARHYALARAALGGAYDAATGHTGELPDNA